MPEQYRKKPVVIEAAHLDGEHDRDVYLWVAEHTISYDYTSDDKPDAGVTIDPTDGRMLIRTLEGEMRADPGDWIIRGVQGEFYPCKPDIFEATYERVPAADATKEDDRG
jgi:hypothetical protein